jgi:hypothetical protein
MNLYDNDALTTTAASVTDVSIAIVLGVSALLMLLPFAMLVGLAYSGIRERARKGRP